MIRRVMDPLTLSVSRQRARLASSAAKLANGRLVVGFIGGSITDSRPGHNWPEPVMAWFVDRFPDVTFVMENAGIGATSSDFGAVRAKRHLIDRHCDLVFVEYAVNDKGMERELRRRTREGLIRKLLCAGIEVVVVYTYSDPMYEAMSQDRMPESIADFEVIAEHYGLSSVWMGLHAFNEVRAGKMRWEQWLPDGLHPQARGSLAYAEAVTAFLGDEFSEAEVEAEAMKLGSEVALPLCSDSWEDAYELDLDTVTATGPWFFRHSYTNAFVDDVLTTVTPGASMSFDFEGRGVFLVMDFGKISGEFRYRIDDGEWQDVQRERFDWVGRDGWNRITHLNLALSRGSHRVELETTKPEDSKSGTSFDLVMIGVLP